MSRTPTEPATDPPADLLLARSRARDAFRQALLRLQAAAALPGGVTRAMEEECAAIRAAWRQAEAAVDALRDRPTRRAPQP
jgi:hypothetical protein